jgi:flavin-dependent dehydrogenase
MDEVDVLVVGAGAAGLAAARRVLRGRRAARG